MKILPIVAAHFHVTYTVGVHKELPMLLADDLFVLARLDAVKIVLTTERNHAA